MDTSGKTPIKKERKFASLWNLSKKYASLNIFLGMFIHKQIQKIGMDERREKKL